MTSRACQGASGADARGAQEAAAGRRGTCGAIQPKTVALQPYLGPTSRRAHPAPAVFIDHQQLYLWILL